MKDPHQNTEELPMTERDIAQEEFAERFDQIAIHSTLTWPTISGQILSTTVSPFYLIRFSFFADKRPNVICNLDEAGQEKIHKAERQSARLAALKSKGKKPGSGNRTLVGNNSDDDDNKAIMASKKPKKKFRGGHDDAITYQSTTNVLAFFKLDQLTHPVQFHQQMTALNFRKPPSPGEIPFDANLRNLSLPVAPKVKLFSELVKSEVFAGQMVKDVVTGKETPFRGEEEALREFEKFMRIYQPNLELVGDKYHFISFKRDPKGKTLKETATQKTIESLKQLHERLGALMDASISDQYTLSIMGKPAYL
jgi:hypothetical protein